MVERIEHKSEGYGVDMVLITITGFGRGYDGLP
jgi:hypothetical protein